MKFDLRYQELPVTLSLTKSRRKKIHIQIFKTVKSKLYHIEISKTVGQTVYI